MSEDMDEAGYWKAVSFWMGDVIAATASHQIMLKSVGSGEKRRQANIAAMAADALDGRYRPLLRSEDFVIKRLRLIVPDA